MQKIALVIFFGTLACMGLVHVPETMQESVTKPMLGMIYSFSIVLASLLLFLPLHAFLLRSWKGVAQLLPYDLPQSYVLWIWFHVATHKHVDSNVLIGLLVLLGYSMSFSFRKRVAALKIIPDERLAGFIFFSPLVAIMAILLAPIPAVLLVSLLR